MQAPDARGGAAWPPRGVHLREGGLGESAGLPYCGPMHAVRVEELTKRYGDTLAVDGIGFTVETGETVGLLGGNGAGKTTTLAMLLGLLIPTAGTIRVFGHDMARDRFAALAHSVRSLGLAAGRVRDDRETGGPGRAGRGGGPTPRRALAPVAGL